MNRPTGWTPGPRHDDLGDRTPSEAESPDRQEGRESETDETPRPQAEPTNPLPDGYEPL